MIYKNNEGYADPTAGAAINEVEFKSKLRINKDNYDFKGGLKGWRRY